MAQNHLTEWNTQILVSSLHLHVFQYQAVTTHGRIEMIMAVLQLHNLQQFMYLLYTMDILFVFFNSNKWFRYFGPFKTDCNLVFVFFVCVIVQSFSIKCESNYDGET